MSLKQKRKLEKARKFIAKEIKTSVLVDIVSGTISDVNSGMHDDAEKLTPFHTAGDIRSNPQIKGDRNFLEHAVGAAVGRVLQRVAIDMDLEPVEMMPLISMTDTEEKKAVQQLLNKYQN